MENLPRKKEIIRIKDLLEKLQNKEQIKELLGMEKKSWFNLRIVKRKGRYFMGFAEVV